MGESVDPSLFMLSMKAVYRNIIGRCFQ